jgi:tRNA (guanine-N(7)-)-methyltransferase subunit TRM82
MTQKSNVQIIDSLHYSLIMGPSRMPYQCMARLGNILIAARGSSIDSLNISDGSLLSTWNCPSTPIPEVSNGNATPKKPASEVKPALEKSESSSVDVTLDVSGSPPAKKRRLSKDEEKQPPKELVSQNPPKKKQNNRSDAVASGLEAPAVIALAVTRDGKHVVAVTGEDKTIRVFQSLSNEGYLEQISQR